MNFRSLKYPNFTEETQDWNTYAEEEGLPENVRVWCGYSANHIRVILQKLVCLIKMVWTHPKANAQTYPHARMEEYISLVLF